VPPAGSAERAEVVLVRAALGAAHILSRLYLSPAARTGLTARVQLIAFQNGVGAQQMLAGILHVVSRLDTGQRQINTFCRAVCAWFLFISHLSASSLSPEPWVAPVP
jgi:hypothetical protein